MRQPNRMPGFVAGNGLRETGISEPDIVLVAAACILCFIAPGIPYVSRAPKARIHLLVYGVRAVATGVVWAANNTETQICRSVFKCESRRYTRRFRRVKSALKVDGDRATVCEAEIFKNDVVIADPARPYCRVDVVERRGDSLWTYPA